MPEMYESFKVPGIFQHLINFVFVCTQSNLYHGSPPG